MDLSVVLDSLPVYAEAAVLTIKIAALGIVAALVIGLICAATSYFRVPV